jgi:hypothetical protein
MIVLGFNFHDWSLSFFILASPGAAVGGGGGLAALWPVAQGADLGRGGLGKRAVVGDEHGGCGVEGQRPGALGEEEVGERFPPQEQQQRQLWTCAGSLRVWGLRTCEVCHRCI